MDDQRAASGVFARVSAVQARLPVVIALQRLGGTAWWRDLKGHVTRRDLDRALAAGQVHRIGRGRYALAELPDARRVAVHLAGVVSHLSAAEQHRIPLLLPPSEAHVTLRANAHPAVPAGVRVHWRRLGQHEVHDGLTSALRTVLDCAASLTFPEGLAVADSALRLNLVTAARLDAAARGWRGAGARGVRRVVEHADGRAANPFESALRALALDGGCTGFEPQVHVDIPGAARVDLADVRRRVVLEADSFEWHGDRKALRRDCRRYDELVRAGWVVLRFAWEDVMFDQEWVQRVIGDVVARRCADREENDVRTRLRARP